MTLDQAKESARRVWQAADYLGDMARKCRSDEAAALEQELRSLAWRAEARVHQKIKENQS